MNHLFVWLKHLNNFQNISVEDRQASVSRELTKIFEETKRGTLKELVEYFS